MIKLLYCIMESKEDSYDKRNTINNMSIKNDIKCYFSNDILQQRLTAVQTESYTEIHHLRISSILLLRFQLGIWNFSKIL